MSTAEFIAIGTPRKGSLRTWISGHGLAVALIGCAIFWAGVGAVLCIVL